MAPAVYRVKAKPKEVLLKMNMLVVSLEICGGSRLIDGREGEGRKSGSGHSFKFTLAFILQTQIIASLFVPFIAHSVMVKDVLPTFRIPCTETVMPEYK